jgi:hypothetical protein
MSTTLLNWLAHAMRGSRAGVLVGLGVVLAGCGTPAAETPSPVATDIPRVDGLPSGAVACPQLYSDPAAPYHLGARGTPQTSCGFVEQVRREYTSRRAAQPGDGPVQLRAVSPATGKWYDLVCMPTGSSVTCSGGVSALIYLYDRRG